MGVAEDGGVFDLEDILPSPDAGSEAAYARDVLLAELEDALGELPEAQRQVFIAHELEGRSFKEIAGETDLSVNTLPPHLGLHPFGFTKPLRQTSSRTVGVLSLMDRCQATRDKRAGTRTRDHPTPTVGSPCHPRRHFELETD